MIFLDQFKKEKINSIPKNSEKQIVLVGVLGRGKTTLYNKMTNSTETANNALESNTHRAFMKQSSYGNGFKVLDTPGFFARAKKIQHTAGLLAALTEGPLNRIMVVLQCQRLDIMLKEFEDMKSTFRRFLPLITVVVTHWDEKEKNEKEEQSKQQIQQKFEKIGVNSVIYSSIKKSGEEICLEIDSILENSPPENVILTESEILLNFDFWPEDENIISDIEQQHGELVTKFYALYRAIKQFINDYPKNQSQLFKNVDLENIQSYTVNLMNQITDFAKNYAEQIVEEFEKKNQKEIDELCQQYQQIAFLIHFDLKKQLYLNLQDVQRMTQQILQQQKYHCYNYLRKCVKCGLVWLKVAGCTGLTVCGGIPTKDELINYEKPPVQFQIKYENKMLTVEVNKNYTMEKEQFQAEIGGFESLFFDWSKMEIKIRKKIRVFVEDFEIGEYGCGYIQDWSKMDLLSPQEYQELFSTGLMDYFKQYEMEKQKSIAVKKEMFREQLINEVLEQRKAMKQSL